MRKISAEKTVENAVDDIGGHVPTYFISTFLFIVYEILQRGL